MNKFAERLKYLRESKGVTQAEFAIAMHITQSTVSKWESSTREPNISQIIKIAKFFGETTDFLLGADEF